MKIEKILLEPKDKVELHAQKEVEKQNKLVGSITPFKGHTLFEINCITGVISKCEYEVQTAEFLEAKTGEFKKKRKEKSS